MKFNQEHTQKVNEDLVLIASYHINHAQKCIRSKSIGRHTSSLRFSMQVYFVLCQWETNCIFFYSFFFSVRLDFFIIHDYSYSCCTSSSVLVDGRCYCNLNLFTYLCFAFHIRSLSFLFRSDCVSFVLLSFALYHSSQYIFMPKEGATFGNLMGD